MSRISRRGFVAASGALVLAGSSRARAVRQRVARELQPDPEGLLDLPPGYRYRILQGAGERMSDGYRVPGRCDAMGCFTASDGSLVLMRNHEVPVGFGRMGPYGPGQSPPPEAYDPAAGGGVTRVVLDRQRRAVARSNLVLCGTYWNCAGGYSPWGWLSCEETTEPGHGYVFACDPNAERVAPYRRISAYGRFRHEAATVHPQTLIAYLTEDHLDSCFYRFVPADRSRPFEGALQALRVRDQPGFDLGTLQPGQALDIDWVAIEQPDGPEDTLRYEAQSKGAAVVRRGEGLWRAGDDLYICATAGGPLQLGQVLRLTTGPRPRIELVVQSENPDELDMPDNLTVAPSGHVYMAEDGFGGNSLRRLTLDGQVVDFARNVRSSGEFAGPCFAPDGRTLFVNLQGEGLTLAIDGPFERELAVDRELGQRTGAELAQGDFRPARGIASGLAVIALAALARRRRGGQSTPESS